MRYTQRRQSNGRIIRWSDGTLSLKLGKELFDINQSIDASAGVPRQFIGSQASQPTQSQPDGASKSEGLTYLVAQHKRSQVLQAEAVITGQMSLRPTGMQSETHRMLVRAVGQKHTKVAKLRMAPDPTTDPEREKLELIKQASKQSKKRREPGDNIGRRRRKPWQAMARNPFSDDEDDVMGAFAASDEEADDDTGYAQRNKKRSDKEPSGYQEDDFLVADSDEDDEFTSTKKRKAAAAEGTEDELDRLEAKLEAEAHRDSGGLRHDDDDKIGDMDVESEEESDEEELQVRRVRGASSRRKAPVFDDDEE
jgi:RNA polymerase-associated protein LEO1